MKIDDILIKINDYDDTINKIFFDKDVITLPEVINRLEDYYCEIENLKEQIEFMEQDIRNNYKPINKYEELGMSERNFY